MTPTTSPREPSSPHSVNIYRHLHIDGLDSLEELALDLRWSWSHSTDVVWKYLDTKLWDLTHNPWAVLQTVSREKLESALADSQFRKIVDDALAEKRLQARSPAWFQEQHAAEPLRCVAYFSMEFMLSEALPIYSGGLGNVAGDQLKAASDLGVPVIGIGLLYQQGYFRQIIDRDGAQQALYPYNDPMQLPIMPLRKSNGEWLRVEIPLPGWSLWLRTWQVQVGRCKLYLLDSNDVANYPAHRGITSELYGGGAELRLQQELILGIGGWRLLAALGIIPDVCHMNEGHAAFVVLERALSLMEKNGMTFHAALAATRAGNVFTTHTAVPAGFDRFEPSLIAQYLSYYADKRLQIPLRDLLALGRQNPEDPSELFNMAYLAIRGSGAVNGVSRLHGKVSRRLFAPLFPQWPDDEVPIGYVTNGVHIPSWDSASSDSLWTGACGKERWRGTMDHLCQDIRNVADDMLWKMRSEARRRLVDHARDRAARQLIASGASLEEAGRTKQLFDPHVLTLGFARRFATYKRPNMLLHDPERLLRLLNNPEKPIQLIIAGKAHPKDLPGQAMIREWTRFIARPEARRRVVFLSDYDMCLTEEMVQGVDVWINTPRRPWEACGTSGMKVLANGGLNLSELDGWWAEAYTPAVGWALGDGLEHGEDAAWDAAEAEALYTLLENAVVPEFYRRDVTGLPTAWIARVRESMALLTPRFSANRSVREYTESYYLPAARAYHHRLADDDVTGEKLLHWQHLLAKQWPTLSFGNVDVQTYQGYHNFDVVLNLDGLDPSMVDVELYADSQNGSGPLRCKMETPAPNTIATDTPAAGRHYRASVPATRPVSHYTARVIPRHADVAIPLEAPQILWQH